MYFSVMLRMYKERREIGLAHTPLTVYSHNRLRATVDQTQNIGDYEDGAGDDSSCASINPASSVAPVCAELRGARRGVSAQY